MNDLRPLSTGQLLDRAFQTYRQNFVLFVGISALPRACVLIASLCFFAAGFHSALSAGGFVPGQIVAEGLSGLLVLLISIIATAVATAATTFGVSDVYLGKPTSIAACFARVKGKIGRVIYVSIELSLRIGVGFLLLILPGIYWAGKFGIAVPSVVLEDIKAKEAFPRSAALTKDAVGRIIGIYFLTWLLVAVIGGGVGVALAAVGLAAHGMKAGGSATGELVKQLVSAVVQTVVTPIMSIALTLAYYDQRVRKEAFDLESMMSLLGEPSTPLAENTIGAQS
jgi:hypothetical protein